MASNISSLRHISKLFTLPHKNICSPQFIAITRKLSSSICTKHVVMCSEPNYMVPIANRKVHQFSQGSPRTSINTKSLNIQEHFHTSARNQQALKVDDVHSVTKAFTAHEVETFAQISGDTNPIHVDEEYAVKSRFGKPIVHGALSTGLLSGVLAKQLGAGAVLLHYEIQFTSPLFIDEIVTAKTTVKEVKGRSVKVAMVCFTPENKVIAQGTARLLVTKEVVRLEI